jgi:hypothetical protein
VAVERGDVKARHVRRGARASLVVHESYPPYRGREIRTRARIGAEGAAESASRIACRYLGREASEIHTAAPSRREVVLRPEPGGAPDLGPRRRGLGGAGRLTGKSLVPRGCGIRITPAERTRRGRSSPHPDILRRVKPSEPPRLLQAIVLVLAVAVLLCLFLAAVTEMPHMAGVAAVCCFTLVAVTTRVFLRRPAVAAFLVAPAGQAARRPALRRRRWAPRAPDPIELGVLLI